MELVKKEIVLRCCTAIQNRNLFASGFEIMGESNFRAETVAVRIHMGSQDKPFMRIDNRLKCFKLERQWDSSMQ
jgi:hypothetical protein